MLGMLVLVDAPKALGKKSMCSIKQCPSRETTVLQAMLGIAAREAKDRERHCVSHNERAKALTIHYCPCLPPCHTGVGPRAKPSVGKKLTA